MDFDVIPYEDIVWGSRLGAGSFGSVYKGTYLGIDIAIKEVLPSNEYDVRKYFEREWRIMRECRHPNIVLFLGLSKAPDEDGRVFIISEFVPRGNLRQFILSSHAFPWRLRLSFATDVARAVAYLHARQCIHRDLKGENLLITSNDRVKVTDFGFARIASRNAEEMRRMTYCGTDGYMSPEIINGHDFDLPTDVFSLGIIFVEILSRKLVDSKTYTRSAPSFVPDPDEIRRRASPGCPPALVELALQCCQELPEHRPVMPDVLRRLRDIELEVLSRVEESAAEHVGSIRLVHKGPRAMPVFDQPGKDQDQVKRDQAAAVRERLDEESGDEDIKRMEEEALVTLAGLDVGGGGASLLDSEGGTWRTARWDEKFLSALSDASDTKAGHQRLIPSSETSSSIDSEAPSLSSDSSSEIIRGGPVQTASTLNNATPFTLGDEDDPMGSTITVKGATGVSPPTYPPAPQQTAPPASTREASGQNHIPPASQIGTIPSLASSELLKASPQKDIKKNLIPTKTDPSMIGVGSKGTHRFTLVDKDAVPLVNGKKVSGFTSNFAFAFLPKSLAPSSKCTVCHKRLGQRPALHCDDCSVIVHVKCSHSAPRNCSGGDGIVKAH